MVFAAAPAGDWNLYLVELESGRPLDGTLRRLSGGPGADLSPDWRPGADEIAYASAGGDPGSPSGEGSLDIYLLALDGGLPRPLVTGGDNEWAPRWAGPDRLFYQAYTDGHMTVWLLDANSGTASRLLEGQWPAPAGK
jgi:Tol biopolymer transport system component